MKCLNCKNKARENRKFCSRKCRYDFFSGDNNPATKESVRIKLRARAKIRESNPEYTEKLWQRHEYGWITQICFECKKPFKLRRCVTRKFCSNKCCTDYYSGRNHPLWTGMSNNYGSTWKSQQRKVRQRDNNICYLCGKTKKQNNELDMDVHHIIPFKLFTNSKIANQINNLISLCVSCHRKQLRKLSYFRDNDIVRTALKNAEIGRNVLSLLIKSK